MNGTERVRETCRVRLSDVYGIVPALAPHRPLPRDKRGVASTSPVNGGGKLSFPACGEGGSPRERRDGRGTVSKGRAGMNGLISIAKTRISPGVRTPAIGVEIDRALSRFCEHVCRRLRQPTRAQHPFVRLPRNIAHGTLLTLPVRKAVLWFFRAWSGANRDGRRIRASIDHRARNELPFGSCEGNARSATGTRLGLARISSSLRTRLDQACRLLRVPQAQHAEESLLPVARRSAAARRAGRRQGSERPIDLSSPATARMARQTMCHPRRASQSDAREKDPASTRLRAELNFAA